MDEKKIYWSIREVSDILGLEPNVLRFWEKEFLILCPQKNNGKNRYYQKKDIEILQKIKYLLYEENYTIKGAIKKMKKLKSIPLENYIGLQKLMIDKRFSQEFEEFYKNLSEFIKEA